MVLGTCLATTGVNLWVDAGTLLGLYRESDFIPHDTDVDFGVAVSRGNGGRAPELNDAAYHPLRALYWRGLPMQNAYLFKNEVLDFYFFYDDLKPGFLTNVSDAGVMEIPEDLIRPITRDLIWENTSLPIPNQVENYLTWRYGKDWKTPKAEKEPWFLNHPNIKPLEYSKSLEADQNGTNPTNWKVGTRIVGRGSSSTIQLENLDIFVYENDSLLSLWSSRNTVSQERDAAIADRDAAIADRDKILSSKSWKLTKPLRKLGPIFPNF